MIIRIRKPDDSNEYWHTTLKWANASNYRDNYTVTIDLLRNKKDPVHSSIVQAFKASFQGRGHHNRFFTGMPQQEATLLIGETPIHIKKTSRYYINGQLMKLDEMCNALARVLFKSCFESDPMKLLPYLYSTIELPEVVKYVIENRVPYFFYSDFNRYEVRLNVQRISSDECAIEIGDGIWGNISVRDLENFCSFYVNGHKRSKWKYISPQNLYKALIGKEPRASDLKVLIAFLKQNRMQDIVEKRAQELVHDMLKQYPERLKAVFNGTKLETLYIKGKKYDWKLEHRGSSSGTQAVSTYVWQPQKETLLDDNDEVIGHEFVNPDWRGPICIDNMGANTPVGDQFAGRALALLNDVFTIKIVSTINSYIVDKENENRFDWNEM